VAIVFVLPWGHGFVGAKYGLPDAEPFTFDGDPARHRYVDLIIATKGRASTDMTFESVGTPMEPSIEQKYSKLVVARMTRTTDAEAAAA
jgi:hypothetical protein